MISPDATPIAHHAPLRPISLRPVYTPASREHWEEQIDEMARCAALSRGERLWAIVVEFARTPGFIPQPKTVEPTAGPLIESSGHSSDDPANGGEPRYAVNDEGQPMLLWSKISDFDKWEAGEEGCDEH